MEFDEDGRAIESDPMTTAPTTPRQKMMGAIMLACTVAAVVVTLTVDGTWVFYGCAAFLVIVAIGLPLALRRGEG